MPELVCFGMLQPPLCFQQGPASRVQGDSCWVCLAAPNLQTSKASKPPKPGFLPATLLSCTSCSPNKPLLLSTAPLLGQVYSDCPKEREEGVIFCFSRGDGCSYFCHWCHSPPMRTARQKDGEPQAWGRHAVRGEARAGSLARLKLQL